MRKRRLWRKKKMECGGGNGGGGRWSWRPGRPASPVFEFVG